MKKSEEIKIPEDIAVYTDSKTKAKSIALPFQFPDNVNGVIIITRLKGFSWKPIEDIKSITITYED